MKHRFAWAWGLPALLLAAAPAVGADPSPPDKMAADAQALAALIDEQVAKHWAKAQAEPAPAAADAEFLRRVYLDLAGRIPSVAEARTFLDDKRADKRRLLVEDLLKGPRYVTHWVNVWRALLLPEANNSIQARVGRPDFEAWLRKQVAENVGYDQMVRELVTVPVGGAGGRGVIALGGQGEPSPLAFYTAKEFKPENLAASTARLFLGVRVECAQCHNHPFASWKRDQFWSFAAFFAGIQTQRQGDFAIPTREVPEKKEITIPGLDKVVQARYLDGTEPKWQDKVAVRQTLAEWMTAADNPFFARAAANRLWAHFFGTGLIEPVDEMVGSETVANLPGLLDELAKQFAAHGFDLKFLVRAITASKAYQLTSARTHPSQDDPRLFARMAVKGLTPEQLFDSVAQATGYREGTSANDPRLLVIGRGNSPREEFLSKFANQSDKATESQTSILQALVLMNGKFVADATSLTSSQTLAAVIDAPFMDTAERVETLYLATLARKPRPKELERLVKFVEDGGTKEGDDKDKQYGRALADVLWVLLNGVEFKLNH